MGWFSSVALVTLSNPRARGFDTRAQSASSVAHKSNGQFSSSFYFRRSRPAFVITNSVIRYDERRNLFTKRVVILFIKLYVTVNNSGTLSY